MKKEITNTKTAFVLPEGVMRYTCCASCRAGEYDSKKDMVYCGETRTWRKPTFGCSTGPDR